MDELRLVRRDDQSLIVATDSGEEFRLLVDDAVLGELRQLARLLERGERSVGRVNPREVQSLVRAGKSRAEIADLTGLELGDIERYEEPVLAERRYILELAHAVPVRTNASDDAEEQFGTVIAERLIGLGAEDAEWTSWRDEEAGWMVSLDFVAREVSHRAIWSFEHRKRQLAPLNSEAETLSKLGEVGDRLIPKLRAVDANERFDSGAFDPDRLAAEFDDDPSGEVLVSGPVAPDHPSTGSIPIVGFDPEAEFARRQGIEERAIKSPAPELPDLGQTADLLDALRRRRGERDATTSRDDVAPNAPVRLPGLLDDTGAATEDATSAEIVDIEATRPTTAHLESVPFTPTPELVEADTSATSTAEEPAQEPKRGEKDRRRGRASIPSWDDILFGTRSDEDPASS